MKTLEANYVKRLLSTNDGVSFFCLFGKNGITNNKEEGDMKTPTGIFPIRKIYYREDRVGKIENTTIECIPIEKDSGWCDDVNKDKYNTFVKLPFDGRYENLWREDSSYDIVVSIGYNDSPVLKGKGSAIFLHIARDDMQYTEGCLAIKKEDMLLLLNKISKDTSLEIK